MIRITRKGNTDCYVIKQVIDDHQIVLEIQELLDGKEWDSETIEAIASLLHMNGYKIRDSHDQSAFPELDSK